MPVWSLPNYNGQPPPTGMGAQHSQYNTHHHQSSPGLRVLAAALEKFLQGDNIVWLRYTHYTLNKDGESLSIYNHIPDEQATL